MREFFWAYRLIDQFRKRSHKEGCECRTALCWQLMMKTMYRNNLVVHGSNGSTQALKREVAREFVTLAYSQDQQPCIALFQGGMESCGFVIPMPTEAQAISVAGTLEKMIMDAIDRYNVLAGKEENRNEKGYEYSGAGGCVSY